MLVPEGLTLTKRMKSVLIPNNFVNQHFNPTQNEQRIIKGAWQCKFDSKGVKT